MTNQKPTPSEAAALPERSNESPNLFLSWSGEPSRLIAEILRDWSRKVIQSVRPWMSEEDIAKGKVWSLELKSALDSACFCIVCVTPENRSAPWLLFEAGAVSKTLGSEPVTPLLFKLKKTDVKGPLTLFQMATTEMDEMRKLMSSLNETLAKKGFNALSKEELNDAFDMWWPKLAQELESLPEAPPTTESDRPERELIEEVLERVREIDRRLPGKLRATALREGLRKRSSRVPAQLPEGTDAEPSLDALARFSDQVLTNAKLEPPLTDDQLAAFAALRDLTRKKQEEEPSE